MSSNGGAWMTLVYGCRVQRVCWHLGFEYKAFLCMLHCLLHHLVSDPAKTPPVGTKWHLVCRDAKDELDIMSRPGLPPWPSTVLLWGSSHWAAQCSATERTDLILPTVRIMRNFGISSGSPTHLHSLRMKCEELHCRRDITHLQNNPSFVPQPLSEQDDCVFTHLRGKSPIIILFKNSTC